ncbi:farnesol dehydrogenase [Stomoxys calcitrans]|uniref:Dehydrogenase n=1 Tax=Stomoxys calcitrans TaxID=35570 RepID=A0A1I8Q6C4_STOCA|nr:farnesol dehydrogenase [Stomoxys calcitrans]
MERWHRKIAVVTGSSAGIGAATCKALAEKDMIVIGLARRLEKMEEQTRPLIEEKYRKNFHTYKCDVGDEANVKEAFAWIEKKFGGIDVLINNAGISPVASLLAADNTKVMKDVVNTNVMGVVWCTREAFQSMKKRSVDGHIINVNSVAGHKVPVVPGYGFHMYAPSKHAMTAMTEVLRQELITQGTKVKVTSVSPGAVRTEIAGTEYPAHIPALDSKDVADAIVFCLQTPPHVQIHELMIRPVGEKF